MEQIKIIALKESVLEDNARFLARAQAQGVPYVSIDENYEINLKEMLP